ncbi:hypothetical protein ACWD4G_19580 [Streptomyces sp. NPDC002643]
MTLQIDKIEPAQGKPFQEVVLTGTLLRTRQVLWGDEVLEESDWEGSGSGPGETSLIFNIPEGSGTVLVTAVDGGDKSNTVEFTYQ